MWSAADESPDIGAIRCYFRFLIFVSFLNQSAWNASGVEKRGEISHFLILYEK